MLRSEYGMMFVTMYGEMPSANIFMELKNDYILL